MEKILFPYGSDVILWLLWERVSLVFLSLLSPSQTTDPFGYFRSGNTDCLLLISVRCRHFNKQAARARKIEREGERDRFTIGNESQREKEKKYYRNGQSHHLSRFLFLVLADASMYVSIDMWKYFFSRCASNVHRIEPIIMRRKCYHNERTPMYGQ